ncbi:MAG TPA: sigma-70 family RNA polymerase sigma factor [Pseudonocardiaceae bacterium]|nr:sigma-70 family RNA polymerase sigma factor [Pseudonocardiaceae bacterium]
MTAVGDTDFMRLAEPYRRELLAHCYRMVGSVHDAEDLVQETFLRAWRARAAYEGRASLRTWLYRIATNVCLTAVERGRRRTLPSGIGDPAGDATAPPRLPDQEVPWLQPIPDALLDPADVVAHRDRIRLAFIAALQYLPPRQRAVLILRDVLEWRAAEVAELLDTSTAAVNSALQRARTQLADAAPGEDDMTPPSDEHRILLDRYVSAFEHADVAGLTRLLREDVVLEMPPYLTWYRGRDAVATVVAGVVRYPRLAVVTAANGQPAVALYRSEGGIHVAHSVHVPDLADGGVARMRVFLDPNLFPLFGLPSTADGLS